MNFSTYTQHLGILVNTFYMAETITDSIKVIFGEIPKDCNCTIYRIASRSDIKSFKNFYLPALDGYGQVHKFTF